MFLKNKQRPPDKTFLFIRTTQPKIQTSKNKFRVLLPKRETSFGQLDRPTSPSNPGEHFATMTLNGNCQQMLSHYKAVHLISLPAAFGMTGRLHTFAGPSEKYYSVMVNIGTTQYFLFLFLNLMVAK